MIRARDFIYRIKEDDSADWEHNIFFKAKPIGELIRCKDCKYNSKNSGTRDHVCIGIDDDWFCADGEKVTE